VNSSQFPHAKAANCGNNLCPLLVVLLQDNSRISVIFSVFFSHIAFLTCIIPKKKKKTRKEKNQKKTKQKTEKKQQL
jgi:hypothetical protein